MYHTRFRLSRTFFSLFTGFLPASQAFVPFCAVPLFTEELLYLTTLSSSCQALFFFFFLGRKARRRKSVFVFSVEATLVRRSINIPKARPTVNTFFAFSWTFFRLISAQLDMYIRAPAATTFRLSSAGITPPSHCLCPIAPSLP